MSNRKAVVPAGYTIDGKTLATDEHVVDVADIDEPARSGFEIVDLRSDPDVDAPLGRLTALLADQAESILAAIDAGGFAIVTRDGENPRVDVFDNALNDITPPALDAVQQRNVARTEAQLTAKRERTNYVPSPPRRPNF